jgi:hypothetical protein
MFPPLTRNPSGAGHAPAATAGRDDSGVRIAPAWVALNSPSDVHGTAVKMSSPSPGSGNRTHPPVRINRQQNGRLSDLANGAATLRWRMSGPASRTRTQDSSAGQGRPRGAGLTRGNGMERSARRHEAGGPSGSDLGLIPDARPLHSPHSADSRSRPPRPSRHIRDTGPDGVRERRAPLTGVRFPLCYIGWSRLTRRRALARARRSLVLRAPLRSRRLGFR